MKIFFDIETNMVEDWLTLEDLTTLHCIVASCDGAEPELVTPKQFCAMCSKAQQLIGHNIMAFDIPALRRLINFHPTATIVDTLLVSRLKYPDLRNDDFGALNSGFPKDMVGSHSLKAWGHRLAIHKGTAPDFTELTEVMVEYCKQDVRVTIKLFAHLAIDSSDAISLRLEHEFASIVRQQERVGFPFDVCAGEKLHGELLKDKIEIESQMRLVFPDKEILRVSDKTGKPLKTKIEEFNPGSRTQIAERLTEKYGWVPTEMTPDGRPRVDEAVLESLEYPEAKFLVKYLTCVKRLGQLAEGDNA